MIKKILFPIGVIALFVCFFLLSKPFESGIARINNLMMNKEANGVVVKKVRNSRNHANEQFFLNNNQIFEWQDNHYSQDSFFYKILIGDTIIKRKNSLELFVGRQDTAFILDLFLDEPNLPVRRNLPKKK